MLVEFTIIEFEEEILKKCKINIDTNRIFLYYSKDVEASYNIKSIHQNPYTSLTRWARENFSGFKCVKSDSQLKELRKMLSMCEKPEYSIFKMQEYGFDRENFTKFVMKSSTEYKRKILNVFFSEIIDVTPSDSLAFVKTNARRFRYVELRILAYLRNKNFDLDQFKQFVDHIDEKDVSNQMGIDIGILQVLNIFIQNVRNPVWIDSLIVTHRLTKGLWYNGSKFLNSYTLHNEEHAVTLIRKTIELTNRIDFFY